MVCAVVVETPIDIWVVLPRSTPREVVEELVSLGFRYIGYNQLVWHVRKDDPSVRANVEKLYEIKDDESKNVEFWSLYISTLDLMEKRMLEMRARLASILAKHSIDVCGR